MNHKLTDTTICRSRPAFTILTALFLFFSFGLVNAQTSIDTRFLDNNTNADGSIALAEDVSLPYQSTAESIITYEVLGQSDAAAAVNGRVYLNSITVNSTENLALRLLSSSLDAANFNTALAEINQRQNRDGGVGAFEGFGSDLISTSLALRALSRAGVVNEMSGKVVSYLLAQQNTDGSWSLQDNPNRVESTALVVNALWLYRQSYALGEVLSNGVAYLASQRGTDSLWEEVEGSALALSAILNVEVDRSAYQTSLTNFANLQNANGSFNDDVYLTALGLRVLDAMQSPAPDEIVLSGQAVDGDTGLPLTNVQVELTGPQALSQATDSNGMFSWQDIQPGNYRLTLSLSGFRTLTTDTLLETGDKRDFGVLTLLREAIAPTTGTVIGTVTDATDGSALAGVVVTATGVSEAAMTNADGQFQLNDISPGSVSVQATLPSYATAVASANIIAGQTLIFSPKLTPLAEAQVVVEGVVIDQETSQVLAGVVVRVQGGGNDTVAITDAAGRYEIPGLQAGNLTVSASLAGYQTVSGNVAAPTNTRINFSPSLVLEGSLPEPVANSGIIGRITDSVSGLPLPGADISLVLNSGTQSIVSGSDGEFALSDLNAGTAQLSIAFTGYQTFTTSIELPENIILNFGDVTLLADGVQETAALRGIVVDSRTNEPLTGVVINGQFDSGNVSQITDASGVFEFLDLLDTEGELDFTLDAYNTVNFGLQLTLGETLDIGQIRLRPEDIEELIPDLAIQSLSAAAVSTDLETLAISGSLSASVRNQGNAIVNLSTSALAFYDTDSSNTFDAAIDQILGQVALPDTVAVDEEVSLTIPVSGNLPFRDAPIYVWVDSNQAVVETEEDNNIISTADQCQPGQCPVGTVDSQAFEPVLKWHWNNQSVLTIPLVGPLFDTNQDGSINAEDDPVVVFASHSGFVDGSSATLRAINGRTAEEIWSVNDTNLRTEGSTHPAMGDLNNDGIPEIVMYLRNGGVAAINNDGTLLWQSSVPARPGGCCHYGAINIADIDADGSPDVLAGTHVLNNDGSVKWVAPVNPAQTVSGLAVDLDLDGALEVVLGNRAYRSDGTLYWEGPGQSILHTGFGNFDDDAFPEVVAVGNSTVNLIDHDGTAIWSVTIPSNRRNGGPPTIADVDGDGISEIGVAGSNVYVVYNEDGSTLWSHPVTDFSSSTTGSTVFDFDGDDRAEVVYADEQRLRVFDGQTGEVVFDIPNSSATATEYPVVADIDGDNHAELLVVSDGGSTRGIRAFEDVNDAWVNTRRIWNQYHYHIDNINDDGTIPLMPVRSWQTHNTFRLNTFPECRLESSELAPVVKWQWQGASVEPSADSVYGPVTVGQLTDDNNDGIIDINDTPDVIFGSFGGEVGVLNAVNGEDGAEIWSTRDFDITRFGSTAIGDIDGDAIVEIVVVNDNRSELLAFEHDGSLKWRVSSGPIRTTPPRDAIAIADLDGDGSPEIIHGRRVHNADGTLRWEGTGGFGDNGNYGYLPTVADIDLDGSPEVIAGRTVYSANGDIVWNRTDIGGDGFTGIGNFDEDDFAEIVVVTSGQVYVLEHTGETLWGPVSIPGGGLGGPPTISDLDGDGEPEIGVAGSSNYVALETDGSIRWTSPTQDLSSNRTGSSVFDFEGDGRVEVLYGDELFFRIYDGISGEVLFEIENLSGTTLEYPIVADIDGDNSAEIVFTSSSGPSTGVRAFEASNRSWANTRRIWNQHTYHINNINEDGTIPLQEEPSWLSHNTYRLNTFPGRNVLALPDLTASQLKVVDPSGGQPLSLSARIGNGGGARSLSGVAVRFYNGNPSAGGVLLAEQTLPIIEPGEFTDITINNITSISAGDPIVVVVDPDNEMDECREDNNNMSIVALGLLGDIGLSLNGAVFGSNTDIDLATQITNTGSLEGNYTVALSILDAARNDVASVAAFDVTALPAAKSVSFSNLWNTGTALSDNYIAEATLLDVNGNVLDTAEANFTISDLTNPDGTPNGNPAAALRATTDRPVYHVDDQVLLDALAENITAIHPITNAELLMVVTDASGTELFNETVALSSLAPGQISQAMRALNLVQAAQGVYQYQATLLGDDELGNGGTSLATAVASFEVLNDLNAAIRGAVTVQAPEVSQGDSQVCTLTTLNTGTQDLLALAVSYRVQNVDAQTTVTNDSASVDLVAGGSANQLQSFSTSGFVPGNYACVLEANLNGESRTLAYGNFTVIETPIDIVADLAVSTLPRLLVLVDIEQNICSENTNGISLDQTDSNNCVDAEVPSLEAQFSTAQMLLESRAHTMVDNAADFEAELLSGLYQQYLLLNEHQSLNDTTVDLLREAINRGEGLVFASGQTPKPVALQEVLGLTLPPTYKDCSRAIFADRPVAEFNIMDVGTVEQNQVVNGTAGDDFIKVSGAVQNAGSISGAGGNDIVQLVGWGNARNTSVTGDGGYNILVINSEIVSVHEGRGTHAGFVEFTAGGQANYNNFQEVIFIQGDGCPVFEPRIRADGVTLLDSPIAVAQDVIFGLERSLSYVEREQAERFGIFLNPVGEEGNPIPLPQPVPAVTANTYGGGKAAFIGYDILAEITNFGLDNSINQHASLLLNSLDYTAPSVVPQRLNGVVPVQLSLDNQGIETAINASILWPLGTQLLDSVPEAINENEVSNWSLNLAANESLTLTSWAIPEYVNDNAEIIAEVFVGDDTSQTLYERLQITLLAIPAEQLSIIQQDLSGLIALEGDPNNKENLEQAQEKLDQAGQLYNSGNWELALVYLLDSTDYLKAVVTSEVIALRLRVDELLWQWGQQISEGRTQP